MKNCFLAALVVLVAWAVLQPVPVDAFVRVPVPSAEPLKILEAPRETICIDGVCYLQPKQATAKLVSYSQQPSSVSLSSVSVGSAASVSSSCGGASFRTPVRNVVRGIRANKPVRSFLRSRPVRRALGRVFCR